MATAITFSRANYKSVLALLMPLVLALGWKYPYLGFMVPLVMVAGLVGASVKGRVVCGNFCPRGSFFDTWFKPFGGSRKAPKPLTNPLFRWSVLVALFSFMIFQLSGNIGSVVHWGIVFWRACLFTTMIALAVGVLFRPRAWCSFCPMGTIQGSIGGKKHPVSISASCSACGICEKNCPMGHDIAHSRESGTVINSDCLHCGACIATCPRNALQ